MWGPEPARTSHGPPSSTIEPSTVMLAQHAGSRRIRGEAESLPFPDVSFDAAMAILTVHHWRDLLREDSGEG